METKGLGGTFSNISQRVAFSYLRSLAPFSCVMPAGLDPRQQSEMGAAQRDLHAFFQAFYTELFQNPGQFGLPLDADDSVKDDEPERTEKMQELNRKLKRPRESIDRGIDFLMLAGRTGRLEGQHLSIDLASFSTFMKKSRTAKKFISGWKSIGLQVAESGDQAVISSERFPVMMLALQCLAERCSQYTDEKLGKILFARCDFHAFEDGYSLGALDLYRIFNDTDFAKVAQLHEYFIGMGYKPIYQLYGINGWEVKYQGKRQIKSSPLFQVEYQERFQRPLRLQIKCASSNRIADLVSKQPKFLQEDFNRRTSLCRGDECGWCKTRPHLGPSMLEFEGTQKSVCWYTNPDIRELNEGTVDLIKQYALLHEELLPAS